MRCATSVRDEGRRCLTGCCVDSGEGQQGLGDEGLGDEGLTVERLVGRRDSGGVIRRGEKKLTVDRGELTVGGGVFSFALC